MNLRPLCCFLSLFVAVAAFGQNERPNVIVILSDDMGYSDIGCYGSEIETPNLDQLAREGLRFTQFYNTARCCPTRASLLTGLYPHQAGIGHMMNDRGYEGYRGDLNRHCVTIAEALKPAGYRTYMAGKWHVTKVVDPQTEEDKHNWPLQRGFDRFYGTIHGAGNFFDPNTLTRDNTFISPYADPEYTPEQYYYTDAISDHAVRYIQEHHWQTGEQPFFMYVAYTAAHWPMHALEKDIAKYRGKYDAGYQAIRDARYQRMVELGVIDEDATVNWPIPEEWKETEYLDWDIVNMEVYAAMIDNMDQGIGRIVEALKETGQYENTLILFMQDNGGCAENYGRKGIGRERADKPEFEPLAADYLQPDMTPKQNRAGYAVREGKGSMAGPDDTAIGYGQGWASVSNTPFREYKHWTHEGGISTPLIAHWPNRIKRHGELERTPGHLVDVMATCVDISGVTYPSTAHNGNAIKPMEGKSLVPVFEGRELEREAIYWEHEGNRAVRMGDMKLVAKGRQGDWELYNIARDRSEQNDLAKSQPETVEKMAAMWQAYAERADVLPLNPKSKEDDKQSFNTKKKFKLQKGDDLNRFKAPYVEKKGFSVSAQVSPDPSSTDGVIVAQGGTSAGWSLYVRDGKLNFVTAHKGKRSVVTAPASLSSSAKVGAVFSVDGEVLLTQDGKEVAKGTVPGPLDVQPLDGLQVGVDLIGAVGDYEAPFPFAGDISAVEILVR